MALIVLDPGHYDKANPYPAAYGFYEGNQMFKLAYLIKPLLEASGIKVIVSRAKVTDNPTLEARGKLAGTNKADLFISLHSDALGNTPTDSARGVTCFYSKFNATENKEIASKLTAALSKYMNTRDRGAQIRLGSNNLDYYGVIRSSANSGCTRAFLLEHGFHSSPSDVQYLITNTSLQKIAEIDAKILAEAVGCKYKGASSSTTAAKPATENTTTTTTPQTYKVVTEINKYLSSTNAMESKSPVGKLAAGTYYVYKVANGSYNLSKVKNVAGSWINPNENKVPSTNTSTKVTYKTNDVVIFKSSTIPVYGGSSAGKKVPTSVIAKVNSERKTKITKFIKCEVDGANVNCALLDTINSWVPLKYLEVIGHAGTTSTVTTTKPATENTTMKNDYSTQTILGDITGTMEKINAAILAKNPNYNPSITTAFFSISAIYGIRGDVALCQSILETGWFLYTGGTAVTPGQHNYCGLGVTQIGLKGNSFPSIAAGVEAQMQHLYAYATNKSIPVGRKLYDPRFNLVSRGSATTWKQLEGKWCASNSDYAKKIFDIYNQIFG